MTMRPRPICACHSPCSLVLSYSALWKKQNIVTSEQDFDVARPRGPKTSLPNISFQPSIDALTALIWLSIDESDCLLSVEFAFSSCSCFSCLLRFGCSSVVTWCQVKNERGLQKCVNQCQKSHKDKLRRRYCTFCCSSGPKGQIWSSCF